LALLLEGKTMAIDWDHKEPPSWLPSGWRTTLKHQPSYPGNNGYRLVFVGPMAEITADKQTVVKIGNQAGTPCYPSEVSLTANGVEAKPSKHSEPVAPGTPIAASSSSQDGQELGKSSRKQATLDSLGVAETPMDWDSGWEERLGLYPYDKVPPTWLPSG